MLSSFCKRALPPAVVSPLILALITCQLDGYLLKRFSKRATQPAPLGKPYSADKLSPRTSILDGAAKLEGVFQTVMHNSAKTITMCLGCIQEINFATLFN